MSRRLPLRTSIFLVELITAILFFKVAAESILTEHHDDNNYTETASWAASAILALACALSKTIFLGNHADDESNSEADSSERSSLIGTEQTPMTCSSVSGELAFLGLNTAKLIAEDLVIYRAARAWIAVFCHAALADTVFETISLNEILIVIGAALLGEVAYACTNELYEGGEAIKKLFTKNSENTLISKLIIPLANPIGHLWITIIGTGFHVAKHLASLTLNIPANFMLMLYTSKTLSLKFLAFCGIVSALTILGIGTLLQTSLFETRVSNKILKEIQHRTCSDERDFQKLDSDNDHIRVRWKPLYWLIQALLVTQPPVHGGDNAMVVNLFLRHRLAQLPFPLQLAIIAPAAGVVGLFGTGNNFFTEYRESKNAVEHVPRSSQPTASV